MNKITIVFCIFFSCTSGLLQAQTYTAIDNSDVTFTPPTPPPVTESIDAICGPSIADQARIDFFTNKLKNDSGVCQQAQAAIAQFQEQQVNAVQPIGN